MKVGKPWNCSRRFLAGWQHFQCRLTRGAVIVFLAYNQMTEKPNVEANSQWSIYFK